jgi:PTH1 family peptidyl-tRNA hydrolase
MRTDMTGSAKRTSITRRGDGVRRGTPADLLVVGLGNPGAEYIGSRHNVGFEVIDRLAQRHGGRLRRGKERAFTAEVRVGGAPTGGPLPTGAQAQAQAQARVALAQPQTFMNLSGESVAPLVRRYGIDDLHRLVIVHDELDLPVGRLKVKIGGGLAGHNGLRSIKAHLHTDDFIRVRIGVGKPPSKDRGVDHVLRKVGKADRKVLDEVVEIAADAIEVMIRDGAEVAMTRFNAMDPGSAAGPLGSG